MAEASVSGSSTITSNRQAAYLAHSVIVMIHSLHQAHDLLIRQCRHVGVLINDSGWGILCRTMISCRGRVTGCGCTHRVNAVMLGVELVACLFSLPSDDDRCEREKYERSYKDEDEARTNHLLLPHFRLGLACRQSTQLC